MVKKCEYRNCNNKIEHTKVNKRFCCDNCRKHEWQYVSRSIKSDKDYLKNLKLEIIKNLR
jgi:hypothetical protein